MEQKTIRFDLSADRLLDLADAKLDEGDHLGALRLIHKSLELYGPAADEYAALADTYEEMELFELSAAELDSLYKKHEIPAGFLEKMWRAVEGKSVACNAKELQFGERFEPPYPWKRDSSLNNRVGCPARDGYAIAVELPPGSAPGELFNHRGADGRGELLELTRDGRFVYTLDDGTCECRMASEPVPGIAHGGRLVVNVDCGPAIVCFLWNGCFLDGGEDREFGWRRFDRLLVSRINRLKPHFRDGVRIRFFDRAVMTAEAPALFE